MIKKISLIAVLFYSLLLMNCAIDGYYREVNHPPSSYIINISANRNSENNPLSIMLAGGSWDLNVIGPDEGGEYISWKAWIYKPSKNKDGEWTKGWLNTYSYYTENLEETICSSHQLYGTPEEALVAAIDSSFILPMESIVNFYIPDEGNFDNSGGISLLLSPQQ